MKGNNSRNQWNRKTLEKISENKAGSLKKWIKLIIHYPDWQGKKENTND